MNEGTGGGRGRPRRAGLRAGVLAAALAGIALPVAACGGGGSSTATGSTPYQKTLAYAQCMRSHGEPGFPDPTSQGVFPRIPPPSPQYLSASKACGHLLPTYTVTPAQRRQDFSRALRFSACMRSHGILSYRDPIELANGNIELGGDPGPGSSPQLQAAWQACRQFGPAGGS